VVADSLSRPPSSPPQLSVSALAEPAPSLVDLAEAQQFCPELAELRASSSLTFSSIQVEEGLQLHGDVSTGAFRPYVPVQLRQQVFDSLHAAAHPGVRASKRLVSSRYVWPGLAKDVGKWAQQCIPCQRAHIPMPRRRFQHIHVDLVGPLPESRGYRNLFTIIDRSTRWFEAIPLTSTTANDCTLALFSRWIARFRVPEMITSDRGVQFTSSLWNSLCQLLQIQHHPTTEYHPQSNGMVERVHQRLKDALRARATGSSWADDLPWVLLGLRAQPRDDSGLSPAEAVFRSPLVLPGQFLGNQEPPGPVFFEQLRQSMSAFQPAESRHNYSSTSPLPAELPPDLLQAECVLVRRDAQAGPLAPAYDGPYRVLQQSPHFFKLQLGDCSDNVSVHRLKAAYMPASAVPALPPRRGRPPAARKKAVSFNLPDQPAPSGLRPLLGHPQASALRSGGSTVAP